MLLRMVMLEDPLMALRHMVGGLELLPVIKPLWERLNSMNVERSLYFGVRHRNLTFEERMRTVHRKASGGVARVEVVLNGADVPIGYCVATIDPEHNGEVDSIYVEEGERDQGVGGDLLDRAIDWMRAFPVQRTFLSVTVGNVDAPRFYERHGFRPRNTIYELDGNQ
jgi:ribosomal protein S18 acetylase RimI-like enzyme